MLLSMLVAMSCGAVQVGGTAWVNAYEFGDHAWTPAQAGEYAAWAWVKRGTAAEAGGVDRECGESTVFAGHCEPGMGAPLRNGNRGKPQ